MRVSFVSIANTVAGSKNNNSPANRKRWVMNFFMMGFEWLKVKIGNYFTF
jgi:hypothetical protein